MDTNHNPPSALDQALKQLKEKESEIKALRKQNKLLSAQADLVETKNNEIWQLRHILSLMPSNIYWTDVNGVYLGCNENNSRTVGLNSPEELIGKTIYDIISPENASIADAVHEMDMAIISSGEDRYFEEVALNANGEYAYYLTQKAPFYDHNGKVSGILGVSFDISDRKKMEEELRIAKEKAEEASLQKSEFIANMSHDIKTPLAGIFSIAELLSYQLEGENLQFANILLSSSKQLLNFFDNCLEIFKLENNSSALVPAAFDLRNLLNELSELFQPICHSKGLTLNICFGAKISFFVVGNRPSIYRILLNLIGNAIKFTHTGEITVSCHLKEQNNQPRHLVFTVEDTGIGIPKNKLDVIFERFMRLTSSYKGVYDGSGIGLYLVQKSVAAMGGKIHVESEENVGSKFIIELPIQIPSHEELDKTKSRGSISIHGKCHITLGGKSTHTKVLLVEDNLIVQRIQTALLASLNCTIEIADSGEKALEMFEPDKYDLIFMDIGLPGIPGDLAAEQIRELERESLYQTPIIALTAHATEEIKRKCLNAGINKVMNKPLALEDTKEILERFCGVEL